jgi:integrase
MPSPRSARCRLRSPARSAGAAGGRGGQGRLPSAKRLRQRLSAIFAFGIARQHCAADPAAVLARAMQPARPPRSHAALHHRGLPALLAACESTPARPLVRLASRFLALTAVRLDAVRGMRWGEIEGGDDGAAAWRVPPERMKLAG